MNAERYFRVLIRNLWIVVLCALVGAALAYWQSQTTTVQYRASAVLLINPFVSNTLVPIDLARQSGSLAATYDEFIRTRAFASLVAERLGPDVPPEVVQASLSTANRASSQFFQIQATSALPQDAIIIANATADTFVQEQATRHVGESGGTPTGQFRLVLREKLVDELGYYQRQLPGLRERFAEVSIQRGSNPSIEAELQRASQSLQSVESAAVNVLNNLVSLEGLMAGGSSAVLIDRATEAIPLPGRGSNQVLSILVALVVGVAIVFCMEYLDRTIRTPEEMQRVLGVQPLGLVGVIGRDRDTELSHKLVTLSDPRCSESEAFRVLGINLQYSSAERPLQILAVTSAQPEEGKTVVATNLAIAFAQAGKETVLIDADLRRPGVHHVFRVSNQVGLSTILRGDAGPGALRRVAVPGLWLLTSGPLPTNPAGLLGSPRMDHLMRALRELADVVIIDTPPVGVVGDAALLSTKVDATVQVVQYGSTRRDAAERAKKALDQVGGHVVGSVLNRIRPGEASYYYYNYNHYYLRAAGARSNGHNDGPAGLSS